MTKKTTSDKNLKNEANSKNDTITTTKEDETPAETMAADATVEQEASETAVEDELTDESEALKAELEQLKTDQAEKADQLLRLTAEFDNFRRRTIKEKEDLRQTAAADLLGALLPVLDNFDRALAHAENSPVLEGILMVQKQLVEILANSGLAKVGEVGEAFDPNIHDAIMQEEKEGAQPDTVLEVLQPGYKVYDKLLRAAMVKVAK